MILREIDVLLAEDDAADAELILASLGEEGLDGRVHTVRDGEEALDFLFCRASYSPRVTALAPRLVLLDIKLPKLTGLEVLRAVKQEPRTRAIPVVMLTSSVIERDVQLGYDLGANSYIQKPVDFAEFRDRVRLVSAYWLTANIIGTRRQLGAEADS